MSKFEIRELSGKLAELGLPKEFDVSWALRLYVPDLQGVSDADIKKEILVRVHYREHDFIYYCVRNEHSKFV
ncbi:MAG TPA: hypothetical protein ENI66_00680 [Candidatus Yonathbacteria bacterium]|nr:hypothetical protein [Candidatus Yonathbacteria bacterium]